jgi:phage-related protein
MSDTILVRLRAIGAKRFSSDMNEAGDSAGRLGDKSRRTSGGLAELSKGSSSARSAVAALGVVCGIAAGAQAMGLLVQATGAGVIALGALGVAAIGAGAVLMGFAAGATARFKQMADVGGTSANLLKERFESFKTLLSDELGPAFDPVFRALASALRPLGQLVRAIAPAFRVLGQAVADAVTQAAGLLQGFGPGLSQLLRNVARLVPVLVPLFGQLVRVFLVIANAAMPYLIRGLQQLTTWLSGLSSGQITGAVAKSFQTLADVFAVVVGIVRIVGPILASLASGLRQVADGALPGVVQGARGLREAFDAIVASGALKTLATAIGATFGFIATVVGKVFSELQKYGLLKPVIVGIVAALTAWKAVQIALNIAMMANPVGLLVVAIAALVVGVIYAYRRFEGFRNAVNGAWGVLKSVFGWIGRNWKLLVSIIGGPLAAVVVLVASNFGRIKSAATSVVGFVRDKFNAFVSFFKGLPGRVAGAASSIGKGIVDGIVSAIKAAPNAILDALTSIVPDKLKDAIGGVIGGVGGAAAKVIPGLATGGLVTHGGMALVGERGPELVTLSAGAQVHSADSPLTKAATAKTSPSPRPRRDARQGATQGDRQPIVVQAMLPGGRMLAEAITEVFLDQQIGLA